MIAATTFAGKRVALFGLGGSGLATARALMAGGAEVIAWDDNPDSVAKAEGEGIATGNLRETDWSSLASFVLSPGVPLTHPRPHWSVDLARQAGVEIVGDIEIFSRERRARSPAAPFIAITGTNGKSTTTALIAHILGEAGRDVQLGGNIGTAILSLETLKDSRFFVAECSSYQIDLAPSLDASTGVLLNISPDHLDRHGTMENYASIKARLVAGARTAVVGVDDAHCAAIADSVEAACVRTVRISRDHPLNSGVFADGSRIALAEKGNVREIADLAGIQSLRGRHNAQNAAAAIAACLAEGVEEDRIVAALKTFPGLKHRMQPVARIGEVLFVNDSKATNADAAAPALSSFDRIYWIAGGLPKEGGIASLSGLFGRIARAYLIGEAAPAFAVTLGDAVAYEIAGTLDKAVEHAARDAREAGVPAAVLLSPACASFDQYRNFEVRGDAFVEAVASLEGVEMLVPVTRRGD